MLSFISWSTFLTTLSILLGLYYVSIASLFYRSEIMNLPKLMSAKKQFSNQMIADSQNESSIANRNVHELIEDLKNLLTIAAKAKTIREELVMAIQMLLRGYGDLKDLPIHSEITQHIKTECQNICSITLSDAELKMLWNG